MTVWGHAKRLGIPSAATEEVKVVDHFLCECLELYYEGDKVHGELPSGWPMGCRASDLIRS